MITYDPDTGFRIHHHTPAPGREGEVMTAEELRLFAIDCLMTEYEEAGYIVTRIPRVTGAEADFTFATLTQEGEVDYRANVIVTTDPRKGVEYTQAGPRGEWAIEQYRKTGAYPRLTLARPYLDMGKPLDDASIRCGCECFFAYRPYTLFPSEDTTDEVEGVTSIDLAIKLRDALTQGDYSIIEPYLDFEFRLLSIDFFDELPCRIESLDYLRHHAEAIRSRLEALELRIGRRRSDRGLALYGRSATDEAQYDLKVFEGMIRELYYVEVDDDIEEIDPEDNIFQSHGDHLDGILTSVTDDSLEELLQTVIRDARVAGKVCTTVTAGTMVNCDTDIFGLTYGEGDVTFHLLMAADEQAGRNLILSLCPSLSGTPTRVTIDKVIEWDNQVEATIFGTVGDATVCFFATDYYAHKDLYRSGEKVLIDLAALGLSVERTVEKISFTGEQAADFRQKIGQEPEYNEDGSVKPFDISMREGVAYLPTAPKTPDVAQFMSPVTLHGRATLLDIPFYRVEMTLLRDTTRDDLNIPLYFRQDMLPDLRSEDSISGVLWLTGSVHVASEL